LGARRIWHPLHIAESFAPIFYQNCVRNGLLPVVLDQDTLARISGTEVTVDLPAQTVTSSGQTYAFDIGEEAKTMLVEGLDGIDLTLKHADTIAAWQAADRTARPYIYLGDNS